MVSPFCAIIVTTLAQALPNVGLVYFEFGYNWQDAAQITIEFRSLKVDFDFNLIYVLLILCLVGSSTNCHP